MVARHLIRGREGEQAAERYLRARGYTVQERNWRCRSGELDLVCLKNDCIVFVEVKTRTRGGMTHPAEAVTRKKQSRIIKAASAYLSKNNLWDKGCRFDMVTVITDCTNLEVEHVENAFQAGKALGGGHASWQPW